VLGAVAFLAAVWALLFVILRAQRADIGTEDRELDAKTEFMAKWQKDRLSKASPRPAFRQSDQSSNRPQVT